MEHAARTCCDHHDTERIGGVIETLRTTTEVSEGCLDELKNAICAHCDPDTGSGVSDGFCLDYCDKLFDQCKDEFYDPLAERSSTVPICKKDSLLCSKFSDHVSTGKDFCELTGFPVSKLVSPTMAKDHDCYNGSSTVHIKYDRLDIDFDMVNERDFGDDDDDEEDEGPRLHILDWEHVDEHGEDVFDRIGAHIFGGPGFVAGFYYHLLRPTFKVTRSTYRGYFKDTWPYFMTVFLLLISYNLFVTRRVQDICCDKEEQ